MSYDFPCISNDTDELTKQKETHRLREQTWLLMEWSGEGIIREFGMVMYTLVIFKMENQQGPTV